jgi:hypothetical protein
MGQRQQPNGVGAEARMEMKPAIRLPDRRPYGAQAQWDRHVRKQRSRIGRRALKIGVVVFIVMGILVFVAAPLSFG